MIENQREMMGKEYNRKNAEEFIVKKGKKKKKKYERTKKYVKKYE